MHYVLEESEAAVLCGYRDLLYVNNGVYRHLSTTIPQYMITINTYH